MARHIVQKDLEALAAEAIRQSSENAERKRLEFITPGTGKGLEYIYKAQECEQWIADPDPDLDDYPLIRSEYDAWAEAGDPITAQQAFEIINTLRLAWVVIGEQIAMRERWAHLLAQAGVANKRADLIENARVMPFDDIQPPSP